MLLLGKLSSFALSFSDLPGGKHLQTLYVHRSITWDRDPHPFSATNYVKITLWANISKLNISNDRFTYYFTLLLLMSNIYCCQHNFLASPLPCVFLTLQMEFLQSFNCRNSITMFTFFFFNKRKERVPGERIIWFQLKIKNE